MLCQLVAFSRRKESSVGNNLEENKRYFLKVEGFKLSNDVKVIVSWFLFQKISTVSNIQCPNINGSHCTYVPQVEEQ